MFRCYALYNDNANDDDNDSNHNANIDNSTNYRMYDNEYTTLLVHF